MQSGKPSGGLQSSYLFASIRKKMIEFKIFLFMTLVQILICSANGHQNLYFREDYTYMNTTQSFYKIHTIALNWPEARKKCAEEGASLFYAEDKSESDAVVELWKNTQPSISWLFVGISDLLSEGEFVTIDGRPIEDVYHGWGKGQPDDTGHNEDCLIVRKDGTLNDVICLDNYHFVCKKSWTNLEGNNLSETPDKSVESKNTFFRKEYFFLESTNSFYRFHTIERTWQDAKLRCEKEGSTLFIPENQEEVNALLEVWTKTQPQFTRIWVGMSSLFSKGDFDTLDGRPIRDVFNKFDVGEPNNGDGGTEDCVCLYRHGVLHDRQCRLITPFICKKSQQAVEWNTACDLPDPGYVFNAKLGKCYKFHSTPMVWTEAYSVCYNEQSYLAIANSKEEADFFVKLANEAPKDHIVGDYYRGEVYLGFHNWDNDGWTTVKHTRLADTGFISWGPGQPDNAQERCGTIMLSNSGLNDLGCDKKCIFVCEHDVVKKDSKTAQKFELSARKIF